MLKKILKIFSYFLFLIFLIFFFAHTQFPGKKAGIYFSNLIHKKTGANIVFDDIELRFPLRVKLINPVISHREIKNLKLNFIEIKPGLFKLITGKAGFKITASGFDGGINARGGLSLFNPKENGEVLIEIANINLGKIFKSIKSEFKLKGNATGRVKATLNGGKGDFSSVVKLANFSAESKNLLIPLEIFKINGCEVKGKLEGNKIILDESKVSAEAGITSFSGYITPSHSITGSSVKIKGKVVPNSAYLGKNKSDPALSMIFSMIKGKTKLEYSLEGSLHKPRIQLK